jgi:nucleotide-binding universal stress UspA family protein
MFSKILVPLDGSELSEKALSMAQNLASSSDTSIHLIQVISLQPELDARRGSNGGSITVLEMEQDAARRLIEAQTARGKEYLEGVAVQLQKAGINVVTVIREGAAGENIVEYAKEQDINLIVMSTHGRSGFKRFFVGSVTDRVIRSGETPVLVLPALSASSRL